MAVLETTTEAEYIEPEQPPVDPAIEALKFIQNLNPESPEEIRDFFEEYQLDRVIRAVIETFGGSEDKNFSGRGLDKWFSAAVIQDWFNDGTSLPSHINARVVSHPPDETLGVQTSIKALFIHEDGTLIGRETLEGKFGKAIKHEDFDQLDSFGILQYLCGAMKERLEILKDEREKAESQVAEEALAA